MKNPLAKYWIFTLFIAMLACKETHEVTPATYSLLLTGEESKSWQQESFTFYFNDPEVEEMDANTIYGIDECEQDDIYTFLREGKQLEVYQGREKCDEDAEDLLFRTTWDIVNANASLYFGGGEPFILSDLTESTLEFGFRDTLSLSVGENTFWEFPGEARWVYKPINQ